MLVNPRDLWQGWGHLEYSEQVEQAMMELVFGSGFEITEGFNPDYDAILSDGTKIEIKISSSKTPFIETSRYDGTPSGLSITKADYYLILHKGWYIKRKEYIGKVKLISTDDLRDIASIATQKTYPPTQHGPGSQGFLLGRELANDGWLGNVKMVGDSYDISCWMWRNRK